jgi:hypothetical protein
VKKSVAFFLFCFLSITVFAQTKWQRPLPEKVTLYYESGKSDLTDEHKTEISNLISDYMREPYAVIHVDGHTDNVGNKSDNLDLSKQRAQIVAWYIMEQGVRMRGVKTAWYGNTRPKGKKGDENRRVEIWIERLGGSGADNGQSKGKGKGDQPGDQSLFKPKAPPKKDDKTVLEEIMPAPQKFCINPYKDTVLKGSQGIIVSIPANSFQLDSPVACVDITLKEALTKSSMLLYGLNTKGHDDVLESGGMFYFGADVSGRPLKAKPDNAISYFLPTENPQKDMVLYTLNEGTEHPSWELYRRPSSGEIVQIVLPRLPFEYCDSNYRYYRPQVYCPTFFCKIKVKLGIGGERDRIKYEEQQFEDYITEWEKSEAVRCREVHKKNQRIIDSLRAIYGPGFHAKPLRK